VEWQTQSEEVEIKIEGKKKQKDLWARLAFSRDCVCVYTCGVEDIEI
jgi:hypothetical protein